MALFCGLRFPGHNVAQDPNLANQRSGLLKPDLSCPPTTKNDVAFASQDVEMVPCRTRRGPPEFGAKLPIRGAGFSSIRPTLQGFQQAGLGWG